MTIGGAKCETLIDRILCPQSPTLLFSQMWRRISEAVVRKQQERLRPETIGVRARLRADLENSEHWRNARATRTSIHQELGQVGICLADALPLQFSLACKAMPSPTFCSWLVPESQKRLSSSQ